MPSKLAGMKPRRVLSAEDRNASRGGFITLKKTGDQFIGHALFKPDPELKDNKGYYEYFEHYTPASGYCACPGENCPFCEEGDNPSTRAKTLWYADGEVKIFNLNYYMIQDFVELMTDGDPILGQQFRVKRQEGNGKYSIRPKPEKLKAAELKQILKGVEDDFLEKQATRQMRKVLEELDLADAMEEDADAEAEAEEAEEKPKARKGTEKKKAKDEEPEEEETDGFDPDSEDSFEGEATVTKVVKSKNIVTVEVGDASFVLYGTDEVDLTDLVKGQVITVEAEKDEDGDFVVSELGGAASEEDEEPEEADVSSSLDEATVTVTSVNSDDETLTVADEEGNEFELFFLGDGEDDNGKDWSEFDVDDFEEGQEIIVTAARDEDGDMLASVFPEPVKAKGKTSGKKAGSKKK